MIRSTTSTLRFCNPGKLDQLHQFIDEYQRVVGKFVDLLWERENIPQLLPKELTEQVATWLSARILQCAGKQASGIVRGTQKKQKQRKFVLGKLLEEGKYKKARKLQRYIEKQSVSKPFIGRVCPELDSRFVEIDLENETTFDGWIRFGSIGNRLKLNIPFKKSKHFNRMLESGKIKTGVRISKTDLTFMFDLPGVEKRTEGETIGIDIGQTTAISCSNGFTSQSDLHGHTLTTITEKLCSCKKGSKAFERAQAHRKNYINWTINKLNFDGVKILKLENIKNMRKGRKTNRRLGHWTYTDIFSKLEKKCEEQGVLVKHISPTYTSKRCSNCGWTRRRNRKGKQFKCGQCGFTGDSDLNASRNIAACLEPISYKKRHQYDIRTGFYWNTVEEEPVVPPVKKPKTL